MAKIKFKFAQRGQDDELEEDVVVRWFQLPTSKAGTVLS
jgi:hypothetical protein